jgi:hypothetical protein
MDDEEIQRWTEIDLIRNVLHYLRQYSSAAHDWIQFLTSDQLDACDEQFRQSLLRLRNNIENIVEINRWMEVWALARKESDREE